MGKRKAEYKRKTAYAIRLLLMICILSGILSGCGGEGKAESMELSGRESLSEEKGSEPETDAESGENEAAESGLIGGGEKDDLTLQEELRPAIVQIYCGDYRGSGVVWEITEEEVRVISSAHLLKNGETCEILCYAGVYYEAKVERILEDCDIGFAVFPAQALWEDGIELRAAVASGRSREELIRGEELVVYGSMDYAAGDFVKGYLIEAESEMEFEGYDSAQPVMLGGIIRESADAAGADDTDMAGRENGGASKKDGDAAAADGDVDAEAGESETDAAPSKPGPIDAGMSGSGVFDRQGRLLGILAGGDGESSFAAVPVWRFV